MIYVLPSFYTRLEFWSVNNTSMYENSELKVFKNRKFLDEISNNWPKEFLRTNVYKTLEFCWLQLLTTLQCMNTASAVSK